MHRRKSAAKPRSDSTKYHKKGYNDCPYCGKSKFYLSKTCRECWRSGVDGAPVRQPPSRISHCPDCGKPKAPRNKRCNNCRIAVGKPPIDKNTYIIEGVRCRRIPLTRNQYAIVWTIDYKWLMQYIWHAKWAECVKGYYAAMVIPGRRGKPQTVFMHEMIALPSAGKETDHVNHRTLDNRRCNLRECTRTQGAINRIVKNTTTGYRGVKKNWGRWAAVISVNKTEMYLGNYTTPEKAAYAYDEAAIKYHGEFAILNFPHLRTRL